MKSASVHQSLSNWWTQSRPTASISEFIPWSVLSLTPVDLYIQSSIVSVVRFLLKRWSCVKTRTWLEGEQKSFFTFSWSQWKGDGRKNEEKMFGHNWTRLLSELQIATHLVAYEKGQNFLPVAHLNFLFCTLYKRGICFWQSTHVQKRTKFSTDRVAGTIPVLFFFLFWLVTF